MKPKVAAFRHLILSIFLCVAGQLFLKFALNHLGQSAELGEDSIISCLINYINVYIFVSVAIYAIGTLFWVFSLSQLDLSFAYPASSLQYVLVFLGAWLFLGENINLTRIGGLFFICLGVVVISGEEYGHRS